MKGLETPERLVDSPYFFGGYLPLPIVIYWSCSFLDSQSQENQTSGQTKQMYFRYPFPLHWLILLDGSWLGFISLAVSVVSPGDFRLSW